MRRSQCELERCQAIHRLAVAGDTEGLPAAKRGGMGIRGARRQRDALLVGNHPQQGMANCKGCNEPYDAKQR